MYLWYDKEISMSLDLLNRVMKVQQVNAIVQVWSLWRTLKGTICVYTSSKGWFTCRGVPGLGSNPAGVIYFHFEFLAPSPFRTAQRSQCKWFQTLPFTCSHSCFRPHIQLIIQGLVYLFPLYTFNMACTMHTEFCETEWYWPYFLFGSYLFLRNVNFWNQEKKDRDMTRSYDKSPYTNRKLIKPNDKTKRHQIIR